MVVPHGACIHLVSTVLTKGLCCYYDMHQEEERHKEHSQMIRNTIRSEWDMHLQMERMRRDEEREREHLIQLQEERRRKLMLIKSSAREAPPQRAVSESDLGQDISQRPRFHFSFDDYSTMLVRSTSNPPCTSFGRKSTVASPRLQRALSVNMVHKAYCQELLDHDSISSLMESSDDDDGSLEEIFI